MLRTAAIALVFVISLGACGDQQPVSQPPASIKKDTAPAKAQFDDTGRQSATWTKREGPLGKKEAEYVGTWIAQVGNYATEWAFMADKIMLDVKQSPGENKDIVQRTMEAVKNDNKLSTRCIWLELRDDRTGFRRACAMINGDASAMEKIDIMSGKKADLGVPFEWFYDEASGTVKVNFAEDMFVPMLEGAGQIRKARFRRWDLKLGKREQSGYRVSEHLPEYDYNVPTQYTYQIERGSFLK